MAVFLVNQCTFSKLPNVSNNEQQTNQQQALGANGNSQTNGVGVGITSSNICGLKFDSLFELIHHIEDNHIRDVDYTSNTLGPFFNGALQQQSSHLHPHYHPLHHPHHHPAHLHSHAHPHQHPHVHPQQQQLIQQPTYSAQSNSTSSQNVTQIINGTWLPTSCILRIFNSTQKPMKQEAGDKNDAICSPAPQMFQQPQPSSQPNLQHHLQQRQVIQQQQQPMTVEMLTPNQICTTAPVQAITIPTKMGLESMSKTITVAGTGQAVNVVKPGMINTTLVGSPAPSPHLVPAGQTMTPIHQTMQQPMAIQQAVITTQMQQIQPQQQHTIVSQTIQQPMGQTIQQPMGQTMQHLMHQTLQPQQYQIHQISQAPAQALTTGTMAAPIQAYSPIAAQLQATPMRPPTTNVVYQQQQPSQASPHQLQPQHHPSQLIQAQQQSTLHPAQAQSAPPQLQTQAQIQQQQQPQPQQTQQQSQQPTQQQQQSQTQQPAQPSFGQASQPSTPAIQKPTKIYKCTECNKPYKTMHGLRAHMSSKHPNATQTDVKAIAVMPDGSSDTPTGSPADFLPQTPSSQPQPSPQPATQTTQQQQQTSLPQKQVKSEQKTQQQQEQAQQPQKQQLANAAE